METILLIEDSLDLRMPIAETLRLEGYSVVEADDGQEGLSAFEKHSVDLVVCDIMMPEVDGYEVLRRVRARPDTMNVPFVFLTAKTEMRDIRKGMQLTADDYLIKPVKMEYLLQSVRAQIDRAQLKRHVIEKRFLDMKENIARMLPHELITPLTAILALSEYLHTEENLDADMARELSGDIHVSGVRLLRMIKNYLVYSELSLLLEQEMPAIPDFEVEPCDLSTHFLLWAQNCAHWSNRADDLYIDVGDGEIEAKANYMEHLVLQLLDNAFKFSQKGQKVHCSIYIKGGLLVMDIFDKGRGMSQEMIDNIELFQQFDRKRYEQQGSGLGLAIVQCIMRLHGGTFNFQSKQGQGLGVHLEVPIDKDCWKVSLNDS